MTLQIIFEILLEPVVWFANVVFVLTALVFVLRLLIKLIIQPIIRGI